MSKRPGPLYDDFSSRTEHYSLLGVSIKSGVSMFHTHSLPSLNSLPLAPGRGGHPFTISVVNPELRLL